MKPAVGSQYTVLVVDDDPSVLATYRRLLGRCGYKTVTQDDSSSADLRGNWAGTYGPLGTATRLTIKNQNGNSFDGVLEQGTTRVAFKGTYDSQSRTLKMNQTQVLSGEGWDLGEDVGKLSENGKMISGTGKDPLGESLGITYQFSFTRK